MKKGVIGHLDQHGESEVEKFKLFFIKMTDEELAETYFKQQKAGITGVRQQMYFLIALKHELEKRFGQSPIEFDGQIIEF